MIVLQAFLITCTLLLCLFYLLLYKGWSAKTAISTKRQHQPITIIVAAHNEAHHLPKLIPALLEQDYPDFEVILALDRCTDESLEVLKQFRSHSFLRILEIAETPSAYSGKKYALKTAIDAAANDLLVFTDADCIPESDLWLQTIDASFGSDTKIAIGYSPYEHHPGMLNRLIRYETIFVALQYFAFAKLGIPYMGVGRNMAYYKSFYQSKQGFGAFSRITGGDDDLFISHHATRLNLNSYYKEGSFVFSKPKLTWKSWFKQKQRHLSVGKHYKSSHQIILSLLGASQVGFWLTFVILVALNASLSPLAVCYFCRMICFSLFFAKGIRTIGDRFEWWWIPLMDVIHTIYLLIIGPIGYFTKKVKWN